MYFSKLKFTNNLIMRSLSVFYSMCIEMMIRMWYGSYFVVFCFWSPQLADITYFLHGYFTAIDIMICPSASEDILKNMD